MTFLPLRRQEKDCNLSFNIDVFSPAKWSIFNLELQQANTN